MKCATKYCRGSLTPGCRSPFCAKCRTRRFKAAHPLKYSFGKLKNRARERGKEFSLTFEQYESFANQIGYAQLKGKQSHSLSIHRKDNDRGYSIDNITAVTLSQNSRLQFANIPNYIKAEIQEASLKLDGERNALT